MPVQKVTERKENGTPILEEEEKVLFVEQNTQLFFDGTPPYTALGKGDLYITDRNIVWLDSTDTSNGTPSTTPPTNSYYSHLYPTYMYSSSQKHTHSPKSTLPNPHKALKLREHV